MGAAIDVLGPHHLGRTEAGHPGLEGREEDLLLLAVMAAVGEVAQDLQCPAGVGGLDAAVPFSGVGDARQAAEDLEDDPMLTGEDGGGGDLAEIEGGQVAGAGHGVPRVGSCHPYAHRVPTIYQLI